MNQSRYFEKKHESLLDAAVVVFRRRDWGSLEQTRSRAEFWQNPYLFSRVVIATQQDHAIDLLNWQGGRQSQELCSAHFILSIFLSIYDDSSFDDATVYDVRVIGNVLFQSSM